MAHARSARQQDDPLPEILISVDVETAGPSPSQYSMLSIGACLVDQPDRAFYIELTPVNASITTEALSISGLSPEHLAEHGTEPATAMSQFDEWIAQQLPAGHLPVFVGFNALDDVRDQAELFRKIRADAESHRHTDFRNRK